jgi:hypothetical protein
MNTIINKALSGKKSVVPAKAGQVVKLLRYPAILKGLDAGSSPA